MPFGAALEADGSVRFRLWAPVQPAVCLVLEDDDAVLPMSPCGDGWHELRTARAAAGSRYRFALGDGFRVPDPASRCQVDDVHGASLVIDPAAYVWQCPSWRGRPWFETVLYELHVGTYSAAGGFDGVRRRLDHLHRLGVTALELLPVADFPGSRNWGYDGVLPFAPDRAYGHPDDLKRLIDEAHLRDLMVFMDVVYNHFGPDGNYLGLFAPEFFTRRFATPWGPAVDFSQATVRSFFVHNALYWLEEFCIDGLRFDAVHAIHDDSERHILDEIAAAVAGRFAGRRAVHLVLENEDNQSRFLKSPGTQPTAPRYDAQWNDDIHHAFHVLLSGETDGYYRDYEAAAPALARGLAEGFIYQGDPSPYRDGAPRGAASRHLAPTAFVDFLQNHDQIGNRAFGDRLTRLAPEAAVRAATAALLLSPHIPLLFMGEEWGSRQPFQFFCAFDGDLGQAVRDGRRREFAKFARFADPTARQDIPDPTALTTFLASKLDWPEPTDAGAAERLAFTRDLLEVRQRSVVPLIPNLVAGSGRVHGCDGGAILVSWRHQSGNRLMLALNLSGHPARPADALPDPGHALYLWPGGPAGPGGSVALPPYSVGLFLAAEPTP
ncbi:MAG: malto-oligosyltrehalose trehalohydrolase [Azospirillum sp.]|nr:malto-oligosyltrehalose trehalohydrolase [Azospirillum sp.]